LLVLLCASSSHCSVTTGSGGRKCETQWQGVLTKRSREFEAPGFSLSFRRFLSAEQSTTQHSHSAHHRPPALHSLPTPLRSSFPLILLRHRFTRSHTLGIVSYSAHALHSIRPTPSQSHRLLAPLPHPFSLTPMSTSTFDPARLDEYNEQLASSSPQEILAWAIDHLPGLSVRLPSLLSSSALIPFSLRTLPPPVSLIGWTLLTLSPAFSKLRHWE
jgi:hypothetical protein